MVTDVLADPEGGLCNAMLHVVKWTVTGLCVKYQIFSLQIFVTNNKNVLFWVFFFLFT